MLKRFAEPSIGIAEAIAELHINSGESSSV
jgi:hypothetical protein